MKFKAGEVVIVSSGQAGTLADVIGKNVWVLLANGDVFVGEDYQIRYPQDKADLENCPLNVERLEPKPQKIK
jgi:hypothetical protein